MTKYIDFEDINYISALIIISILVVNTTTIIRLLA
jgi:hypothetical protein